MCIRLGSILYTKKHIINFIGDKSLIGGILPKIIPFIFYINNAKIMACTNGTLPHNSIFRGKHDFELIILAKTPVINNWMEEVT